MGVRILVIVKAFGVASLAAVLAYLLSGPFLGVMMVFISGPHWRPPQIFDWLQIGFAALIFGLTYWHQVQKSK